MPTIAEIAYHRSFLSSYYLESLRSPGWFANKRKPEEVETIRLRDEKGFESVRENLAKAIKREYTRGMYVVAGGDFMSNTTRWREGNPPDYMVAEVIVHTSQGAVKHPITGITALPNAFRPFNAYRGRQPFHTALIYPKTDQEFEKYATPWELQFSNLVYPYTGGFDPILDESYKVIGHQGEVSRSYLKVPLGFRKTGDDLDELHLLPSLKEKGIPVFVDKSDARGWESHDFYTDEHRIVVKTTTDGEVVDFQVTNKGYLIQPWYSPLDLLAKAGDIIFVGEIGVKLASWGVKAVGSLMSRTTARLRNRAALRGATAELADEAKRLESEAAKHAEPISRGPGAMKAPRYEPNPKHDAPGDYVGPPPTAKGRDMENLIGTSEKVGEGHLINYDKVNKEIVVFRRHQVREGWEYYHGYVVDWSRLHNTQKAALVAANIFKNTGKPTEIFK
jgi:hypothetical protein